MIEFKLPFWISNNGDGSASVRPTATLAEAQAEDRAQSEGWAEDCSGAMKLRLEDNRLFVQTYKMGRGYIWIELSRADV